MSKILVSGLINIETTVLVEGFPIEYNPVRYPFFGVNTDVSGVGYNVAKALTILGSPISFISLTGKDLLGKMVYDKLRQDQVPTAYVIDELGQTPRSVILYDKTGRRQINVDLKDTQDRVYPQVLFDQASAGCTLAVLCNINFSRPFLWQMRDRGVLIASDMHAISNLEDDYNRDFMTAASILFMSDEHLPCSPEDWARDLWNRYGTEIAVVGLGSKGAMLAVRRDNFVGRFPAVYTRPVVNTVGAGDSLFSCFVHFYNTTHDPYASLKKAIVFASHKIGVTSAAEGFLSESDLNALCTQIGDF